MAWRIEGGAAGCGQRGTVHGNGIIIAADFPKGTAATICADEGTVVLESVPPDLEALTFGGEAKFEVMSDAFKKHLNIREVHCANRTAFYDSSFESAPRLARVTAPGGGAHQRGLQRV